eukprot:Seg1586.4 transcript_id=Seg1586.4/GoldUCD/mRNA.D3Y31 product="hypothetical protein" protein_id=Seg1586.4/GoldUCD/D3Y31
MALRKDWEISLKTLVLLLFLLQVEVVVSNFCTAGADYKYCHEVLPYGSNVIQRNKKVYTVHECREFCDRIGCFAFEYQAGATWKLQMCTIFYGAYERIILSPIYSSCNDKTWFYSWKRPIENSGGNCILSGKPLEPLQEKTFEDLENMELTTTANPKNVGLTSAANPKNVGLTTAGSPENVRLTTAANPETVGLTTAGSPENVGLTTAANPESVGLATTATPVTDVDELYIDKSAE